MGQREFGRLRPLSIRFSTELRPIDHPCSAAFLPVLLSLPLHDASASSLGPPPTPVAAGRTRFREYDPFTPYPHVWREKAAPSPVAFPQRKRWRQAPRKRTRTGRSGLQVVAASKSPPPTATGAPPHPHMLAPVVGVKCVDYPIWFVVSSTFALVDGTVLDKIVSREDAKRAVGGVRLLY